ncbi:MAG: hypothetical protein K5829_05485 [Treponema sp.]|nr:hypothetical protein [Treponema sp.]
MFLLFLNRIFSNNPSIWIFSLLLISLVIFLRCFYKMSIKAGKSLKLWRILSFIPLVAALFHLAFFSIKGNVWSTRYYYLWLYIGFVAALLPALSSLWPRVNKILHPLVVTFCIFCGLYTIYNQFVFDSAMRNHSRQGYVKSFISTTKDMEKYYSLKDWKNIDIAALREKLLPVVQKAEETKDERLFLAAMLAYSYYFYDGHVRTNYCNFETWEQALFLLGGNDYGMSMFKLADGRVVAVQVDTESEAFEKGIRNQTEIKSWNGVKINKAIDSIEFIYGRETFPVKATEEIYKPAMLSTKGRRKDGKPGQYDIVQELLENAQITEDSQRPKALVGFIDEKGGLQEVELSSLGQGAYRLEEAYVPLTWHGYQKFPELENLHTAMINEDTAYMARYEEQYGKFFDVLSYFTNRNQQVRQLLIKELTERKKEGMKKLIIDARSNQGGFWAEGVETASLFTKEPFEMAERGSELFGKKTIIHTVQVPADGRFSDIEVLLLVDHYCVSAGDSLVKVLSHCPNVTVMGITPSNCSCQETGGISFLTDAICNIVYPVNWLYELDGRRYIDTDQSRSCTLPLDVQIPLSWELLQSLQTEYDTRDLILDYAVEYLK